MKRIPLLILSAIVTVAFAQYEDFDLAKFKLPEWKYQYLTFRFEGNSLVEAEQDISTIYDTDVDGMNNTSNNLYLNYGFEKNTDKYQRNIRSSLYLRYYADNDNNSSYNYKYRSFQRDFDLNIVNHWYVNPQTFLETDLYLNLDHVNSSNTIENQFGLDTSIYKTKNNQLFIPIKIGKGRIEPVNDARRAIYILEALNNVSKLQVILSDEEIIDFANFIAGIRSERIFDTRLSTIKQVQDIHKYMIDKGYVKQADIIYYTTLDDIWRYSSQSHRYSGYRTSFSVRPGISTDYYKYPDREDYRIEKIMTLDLGGEYLYENPMNLYWQESVEATAYAVLNHRNKSYSYSTDIDEVSITNFNICLMRYYTYTPSTRTKIDFYYGAYFASGIAKLGENAELIINDSQLIQAKAGISAKYYISPKISISGNWYLNYIWAGENWEYSRSYSMPLNEISYYTSTQPGQVEFQSRIGFQITYEIF